MVIHLFFTACGIIISFVQKVNMRICQEFINFMNFFMENNNKPPNESF